MCPVPQGTVSANVLIERLVSNLMVTPAMEILTSNQVMPAMFQNRCAQILTPPPVATVGSIAADRMHQSGSTTPGCSDSVNLPSVQVRGGLYDSGRPDDSAEGHRRCAGADLRIYRRVSDRGHASHRESANVITDAPPSVPLAET